MALGQHLLLRCWVHLQGMQQDDGQGMAEYGLILALVAVVCAAAFTLLRGGISNTLTSVTAKL